MTCVMLHNFCTAKHGPCNPRWRLNGEELELNNTVFNRRANKGESNKNTQKIVDWLWEKAPLEYLNFTFSKLQTLSYRCFANIFVYQSMLCF